MRRWDHPDTLFYLDPPYPGSEQSYGKGMFSTADFQEMTDFMRAMKGQALLSLNDTLEIRETFEGFHIEDLRLTYSVGRGGGMAARELLISTATDASRLL